MARSTIESLLAVLWLLFCVPLTTADCDVACNSAVNASCYVDYALSQTCLKGVEGTWKDQTLDVISQSLENFGFGALYHQTGPPYNLNVAVLDELANIKRTSYDTDFAFQEALQGVLTSLLDAHTRYKKPLCYTATFVLPVALSISISDMTKTNSGATRQEPTASFIKSNFYDDYVAIYPDLDLSTLLSQPVSLIDGVEWQTSIDAWGTSHETRSNNPGARFNAALRSFFYRSVTDTVVSDVEESLTFTMEDGTEVNLPWILKVPDATVFGNSTACLADTGDNSNDAVLSGHRHDFVHNDNAGESFVGNSALHDARATEDRTVVISPESSEADYQISCFVQKVVGNAFSGQAGVNNVLVMKVASFSPQVNGDDYLANWKGFLSSAEKCLSTDYEMIVVDVMQNGGGYVCLGLRLLEMLIPEYWEDHTKVQMVYDLPHSALMDEWIEKVNYPDPYTNPNDVEQILNPETQEPFVNGEAYYYPTREVVMGGVKSNRTQHFCLNCKEAEAMPMGFSPKKFVDPEKLVILTDGTCGSTCASFTRIAQEAEVATFVGTGGLWDQEMDVASFAGGFVMNPTLLLNMTSRMNAAPFPQFATKQSWQFGWAAWYSQRTPSRPVQFTEQEPDHRTPFWAFPHSSVPSSVTSEGVSALYDSVINDQITRIALDNTCTNSDAIWIALVATLGVIVLVLLTYIWFVRRGYGQQGEEEGQQEGVLLEDEVEQVESLKQPLVEAKS
mmetsp:Transcript_14314/g.29428  ORF Transcript_14314/g.29428 Transcript_14314/m.29428 type:complete len:732 (-) Transcript_14314:25-2220(-)